LAAAEQDRFDPGTDDQVMPDVIRAHTADVGQQRERLRRRRLTVLLLVIGIPTVYVWLRLLNGNPIELGWPNVDWLVVMYVLFFAVMIAAVALPFTLGGRSPHVMYRPEQIDVTLSDVKGIDIVKEDVVRSLNLFLSYEQFSTQMGGSPRRGLLFEGDPGTGKTYLAKAMAREAGVPFVFVSATAFQSMYYGATARKIRSYFKHLRKVARQEGGAIGFIEEIDAIAMTRQGMSSATPAPVSARSVEIQSCGGLVGLPSTYSHPAGGTVVSSMMSEGVGGVVNELLVQMQSFDEPTGWQKVQTKSVNFINLYLPADRQLRQPVPPKTNVLLIAATNRADNLDPALLRPGRFDRRLTFERPNRRGRREILDYYLGKKAHSAELDTEEHRDALAAATQAYTPVMIEHLLDEALVNAVRRGDQAMTWKDVERARLVEEVGLGQPVAYTEGEKRLIATHEAGHATVAYLVAPTRRLEILTIVKRREALGLLAHGDPEEVFTRSKTEMLGLIQIALGGQTAEELFFNDISTGPGGDLLYATNVAAEMVGSCGMLGSLISYAAIRNSALNDSNIVGRVLADDDGRDRVEDLLQEQKGVVQGLLANNMHLVAALRDALLERHELIGAEITDVLKAAQAAADAPSVIDLRDPDQVSHAEA
jgi:cell division protease FtsH